MAARPDVLLRILAMASAAAIVLVSTVAAATIIGVPGLFPTPADEVSDPALGTEVGAGANTLAWLELGTGDEETIALEGITGVRGGRDGFETFRVDIPLPLPLPLSSADSVAAPAVSEHSSDDPLSRAFVAAFIMSWPNDELWSLFVYSSGALPERFDFDVPIRDVAVHGTTVVWSMADPDAVPISGSASSNFDLWTMDAATGPDPEILLSSESALTDAQLSENWLVWRETSADGVQSLGASRRDTELSPVRLQIGDHARVGPPRLEGARVIAAVADDIGTPAERTALWLHDLELEAGGELATLGPEMESGAFETLSDADGAGYDISEDLIVRALKLDGADPDGSERFLGEIVAHDARAVTSFHNLPSYLPPFPVARTVTAAARPAAVDMNVFWHDAHPFTANRSVVFYVSVGRGSIYLPFAANRE